MVLVLLENEVRFSCFPSPSLLLCPVHIMAKHAGEICSSLPLRDAVMPTVCEAFGCQNIQSARAKGQKAHMALSTQTEASQRSQPNANPQRLSDRRGGLLAVIGVCVLRVLSVQAAQHVPFHFSFCRSTSVASSFFTLAVHLQLHVQLSPAQIFALLELCSEKPAVT